MKAYEIQGGFGIDNLKITKRPEPAPGPGQVCVRVRACSLNYRDYMTVTGAYNPRQRLPLVPCSDGAGEVAAVGEGATRFKPGDRVMGIFAQAWLAGEPTPEVRKTTLGGPLDGMLAEGIVLHESGLVPVPRHLSFEEAACLPCAGVTAWNALFEERSVKPGDTVLLQGTGGVSIFALQFAKAAGARVIITSSSDEKLKRAKELGAWETVNYTATPEWDKRVLELTDGEGADHVVEVGGAGTLERSLKAARIGGSVSVIGVLSGAKAEVAVTWILMKGVRLRGVFVGSRATFEAMNRAVTLHEIQPVVDRVFPFEKAPDAFRLMQQGGHFGKIVVKV
jgi:NADPH:quinone reductase-like Zn-dependent oxidoreductase